MSVEQQVIDLASEIRNNKHLEHILKQADPKLRQDVYDKLVPLLRFNAKPYWLFTFKK